MTLHAIIEYIRYRNKAMGRHGIHSPFVYSFVEDIIQGKTCAKPFFEWPATQYAKLLDNMCAYYGYSTYLSLPGGSHETGKYDVLLLQAKDVSSWYQQLKAGLHLLNDHGAVLVPAIHSDAAHTGAWRQLCASPEVRLSLDLYGIGLLFFKKEFKVKQHFVLKS